MAVTATPDTTPCGHRRRRCGAIALLLGFLLGPSLASADVIIPAGGVMSLAAGTVDAACTNLTIAGTLNLDTGAFVNLNNVVVQPGGVLNGNSGAIALVGNFTVLPGGQFNASGSSVSLLTTCGSLRRTATTPVPTLGAGSLVALSAALALLAMLAAGGMQRRRGTLNGGKK
jgi:hypothetical protein